MDEGGLANQRWFTSPARLLNITENHQMRKGLKKGPLCFLINTTCFKLQSFDKIHQVYCINIEQHLLSAEKSPVV